MTRLPTVPLEDLAPPLAAALERGRATRMLSSTVPVQVWAHRPEAAQAWLATLEAIHSRGLLPGRLRELVRLKIAAITTCKACQLARKDDSVSDEDIACLSSSDARFSPAEQAALHYAELFAADYMAIGDALFDTLKLHFSTPEIVELHMFCALMLAGGRMTYVQQAYEAGA
ncbi:carboxymuconolactone decarboxylase family protein [Massilia yuzhufengensis]|uniref:Alkylhydroperoxidase AhpD family core domain-containing protein n=1 Tax=Massilia yuzhufengensis TaxID=1164594 RepID=A0A1I1JAG7_9BURK|nr:carboxymuconolactone decarboxylase family protein [Massilia yuzhufengensis]SFC42430.1 alkylhydroperoxidase AhpD family core domain-containing protein [Massilia yuzhufengensis]